MEREIIIYGAGKDNFDDAEDLIQYIKSGIFEDDHGRFDYSQSRPADVIVLSLKGKLYGHFDIKRMVNPSVEEKRKCPTTRAVYIVNPPTTLYKIPVELSRLGIKGIQFGKKLSDLEFQKVQILAGICDA